MYPVGLLINFPKTECISILFFICYFSIFDLLTFHCLHCFVLNIKIEKCKIIFFFDFSAQQRPKILEHPADAVAAREEPLTLNCKAAGRPPPEILWFHNGTPLVPSERRVVLPEGSLFFLR